MLTYFREYIAIFVDKLRHFIGHSDTPLTNLLVLSFAELCCAFVVAWFLTPLVRKIAVKQKMGKGKKFVKRRKDFEKDDHQKIHRRIVIVRMGGVAIYIAFVLAMIIAFLLCQNAVMKEFFHSFIGILIGGTIVFILGIHDDIYGDHARRKIFWQFVACAALIIFGLRISRFSSPLGGSLELGTWAGVVLTVIWVVGITNAINIIDGLDGLAAGVVSIVGLTLCVIGLRQGNIPVVFLNAAIAGAALGFLRHNLKKVRIFMGDSGSMFLGFMLAAMALEGNRKSTVAVALFLPVIVLGVPILDTLWALWRRVRNGKHPFKGDHGHIHHRLLDSGRTQRQVVFIIYFITLFLGLLAFAFTFIRDVVEALILIGMSIVVFFVVRKLVLSEPRSIGQTGEEKNSDVD